MTTAHERLADLLDQIIRVTDSSWPERNKIARMFEPDLMSNLLQDTRLRDLLAAGDSWEEKSEDGEDPVEHIISSVDEILLRLQPRRTTAWWTCTVFTRAHHPGAVYEHEGTSPTFRTAADANRWGVSRVAPMGKVTHDFYYQLAQKDAGGNPFEIVLDSRNARMG